MLAAAENEEWDLLIQLERERSPVFAQLTERAHKGERTVSHTARLQELEVLENSILSACSKERQVCQSALTEMNRMAKAADSYRSCDFL